MATTALGRRALLRAALAAGGALLTPRPARAGGRPLLIGAGASRGGEYGAWALDPRGDEHFAVSLPARGHGFALRPGGAHLVIFARRPGTFARVVAAHSGAPVREIAAAPGRHFYGHGAYSPCGRRLFATENDYGGGRGVIGVYDAEAGYARIAEWDSGGIGPHELRVLPDGTLLVANGGILTHPDAPRAKLNLDTMAPSLAYLDGRTGALLHAHRLPRRWHRLSIRHLDVTGDGWVGLALQYEGPSHELAPIAAFQRGNGPLWLAEALAGLTRRCRNYGGAACFDTAGGVLAVSAPRGDLVTFWDLATRRLLYTVDVADGCGVARGPAPGTFYVSSGQGGVFRVDVRRRTRHALDGARAVSRRWDNHLLALHLPPADQTGSSARGGP